MKYLLLILSLLACTTAMYAQNARIETFGDRRTETYPYVRGGGSIRFTILGKNDTLQDTQFYRNGRMAWIAWKRDSSVNYDVLGRLTGRIYGFDTKRFKVDSTWSYYPNGGVQNYFKTIGQTEIRANFDENGQLISSITTEKTPSGSRTLTKDEKGNTIASNRTDTIINNGKNVLLSYDTVFYANKRPAKTSKSENFEPTLGIQYYNEAGDLTYSIQADSLNLILFKDNVDCYYGLKNKRGDTIVKPRFDLMERQSDDFFAAYTGESAILLDKRGAPMTPPVARLSKITQLTMQEDPYLYINYKPNNMKTQIIAAVAKVYEHTYYSFMEGKNYGVMNEKGILVMPPQYLPIKSYYIKDGVFFEFQEFIGDSLVRTGFLNREGKAIFNASIKNTHYSQFEDYFQINAFEGGYNMSINRHTNFLNTEGLNAAQINDYLENNTVGLGKSADKIVLPLKFSSIEHVPNTSLFVATILKTNPKNITLYCQEGIFDVHRQKWLVDTTNFMVENKIGTDCAFFSVKNIATQKYAIMDTTGKYIVSFSYDSIGVSDQKQGLFWVKKGGKYQILNIKNGKVLVGSTQYDFLTPINFPMYGQSGVEIISYFIARRKDKWGVIDINEKVIKPFDSDYASFKVNESNVVVLVKNNRAASYDLASLPNETYSLRNPAMSLFSGQFNKKINSYPLVDNKERVFFANDTGKVVIPPQYKPLLEDFNTDFLLVEDREKRKKIIYLESEQVFDYPFNYRISFAPSNCRVIIVGDTIVNTYGVVSTAGKVLVPCINYGVAIGDADNSIFFVKRDTFAVPDSFYTDTKLTMRLMEKDTLSLEDNDWLMYNGDGKIVSNTPFRFPIVFHKGVGIGMQKESFHLYKTDGTVLTPFNKNKENSKKLAPNTEGSDLGYTTIWRDETFGHYALFRNQGLTPTMTLTKENGEILVESGRFDGISKFYGKYALVTAAGKVGLIDTFGTTIIEPKDLRTYEGQFMDSLDILNVQIREENKKNMYSVYQGSVKQPYEFNYNAIWHPDSLNITPAQRRILWNLLLEKSLHLTIVNASDTHIPRTQLKAANYYFSNMSKSKTDVQLSLNSIVVTEKTMAFSSRKNDYSAINNHQFYNFYRRDNRWEELQINDLLQVQGEKRWLLNDLITKKVKALKDQQIDCSNASAFIAQVENKFMLTQEGVDFCFNSTGNIYAGEFVNVSFTWAELTPFLKIKIF
jgi:hypothetical protein